MKPEGRRVGTYRILTEDDNKGTPLTKVIFGQESPYIPPSCGGGHRLLPEGNSQPPVNGEREKE